MGLYKLQNIQSFQKITPLFRLPRVVKLSPDPSYDQRKRKVVYNLRVSLQINSKIKFFMELQNVFMM